MTTTPDVIACPPIPNPDLDRIKQRQRVAWASGDYAIVGTTLQIVGESLCEAVDLRAGQSVLDVACGNGNASLAAARRFANVTGVDYVPALLHRAEKRARAEGVLVDFREGDAEALPFDDGSFDVVLSTFGVMFTPDQVRAARELTRVCRRGGKIGLANWTPNGFIGQLFRVLGRHVPPAPGLEPPSLWGTESRLGELFAPHATIVSVESKDFVFRYASPNHWLEVFRTFYGPVERAFAGLAPAAQAALEADILALLADFNRADDGTLVAPSEYAEAIVSVR